MTPDLGSIPLTAKSGHSPRSVQWRGWWHSCAHWVGRNTLHHSSWQHSLWVQWSSPWDKAEGSRERSPGTPTSSALSVAPREGIDHGAQWGHAGRFGNCPSSHSSEAKGWTWLVWPWSLQSFQAATNLLGLELRLWLAWWTNASWLRMGLHPKKVPVENAHATPKKLSLVS